MDDHEITQLNLRTYATIAKHYALRDAQVIPDSAALNASMQHFTTLLQPGCSILDIGCGTGRDSRALSEEGFKLTGIDLSPEMLAEARRHAADLTYLQLDIEQLERLGQTFDAAWANASLLHLPKRSLPAVLRQIADKLTDNGPLFVRVKQGTGEGVTDEMRFGMTIQRYFSYYACDELSSEITRAGFETIAVSVTENGKWIDLLAIKQSNFIPASV